MKRALFVVLGFLFFLSVVAKSEASIISVTGGSDAEAIVNQTINAGSTTTQSSSNCKTSIHVESNGVVKDYNSTDCGSVNVQASNGDIKIDTSNSQNSVTITPNPTLEEMNKQIQQKVDAANKKAEEEKQRLENQKKNLLQTIVDSIKSFFERLFHF